MKSRSLTDDNDWTFGGSQQDFNTNLITVKQNIRTRLREFKYDCFWDIQQGIDWFLLLAQKDTNLINLHVRQLLLTIDGIISIETLDIIFNNNTRNLTLSYKVNTIYDIDIQDTLTVL